MIYFGTSGFCCVDEPQLPNLLPPLAAVTSKIGYVRFHGRNSAKWWQHERAVSTIRQSRMMLD